MLYSGVRFIHVPDGVDFDGEKAYPLAGVAGRGEEHINRLGHIGNTLYEEENIEALRKTADKRQVMEILQSNL